MKTDTDVLVTICTITYNHAPYLRQCLDGILMQQTNFRFEALVHDDCSTDGTTDIVREYAAKYPEIIHPFYEKENQYSKGHTIGSAEWLMPYGKGKYCAFCEGDDYWTDPFKLQKQVDFLESHPDYSVCSHRFEMLGNSTQKVILPIRLFQQHPEGYSFGNEENILVEWSMQSLTLLFRVDCYDRELLFRYAYSRDTHAAYHLLKNGKGFCFPFIGGVYRQHAGGVFTSMNLLEQFKMWLINYGELLDYHPTDVALFQKVNDVITTYERLILEVGDGTHQYKQYLLSFLFNHHRYKDIYIWIVKMMVHTLAICKKKINYNRP